MDPKMVRSESALGLPHADPHKRFPNLKPHHVERHDGAFKVWAEAHHYMQVASHPGLGRRVEGLRLGFRV